MGHSFLQGENIMMDVYQITAVGHHLSDWPEDIDFQTLIDMLQNDNFGTDNDAIIICEYLGYPDGWLLAELILGLERCLRQDFIAARHKYAGPNYRIQSILYS